MSTYRSVDNLPDLFPEPKTEDSEDPDIRPIHLSMRLFEHWNVSTVYDGSGANAA